MAAIAEWRDEYLTGHATIDRQHQNLFHLVNQIHTEVTESQPALERVHHLLLEFASQAEAHFALEEDLMQAYQYPNYETHVGVHQRLIAKVQRLLEQLAPRNTYPPQDITQVLTDWMIHHIRGEDRNMIHFFQNHPSASRTIQA